MLSMLLSLYKQLWQSEKESFLLTQSKLLVLERMNKRIFFSQILLILCSLENYHLSMLEQTCLSPATSHCSLPSCLIFASFPGNSQGQVEC